MVDDARAASGTADKGSGREIAAVVGEAYAGETAGIDVVNTRASAIDRIPARLTRRDRAGSALHVE
jgi:hypothetical protein